MPKLTNTHLKLVKEHIRTIVRLRQAYQVRKLSLILGAGFSRGFGLPNWDSLIKLLADCPKVGARDLDLENKSHQSSRSLMLFHCFRNKYFEDNPKAVPGRIWHEKEVRRRWHEIIRKYLYKDAYVDLGKHPYARNYLPVLKNTPVTVNYNFDDCIERFLHQTRSDDERDYDRGYESVWDARMQFKRSKGVIYHPNGFLPKNPAERASELVVFAEDTFADQMLGITAGHYAALMNHFARNTCLFLGLSLNDSGLKHLLHHGSRLNPGHCDYYVHHCKKVASIEKKVIEAKTEAYFQTYNLATLFLDEKGIAALGDLITMNDTDFDGLCRNQGCSRAFTFYIAGSIGAGKTSVVSHFHDLAIYDEWIGQRHRLLNKQPPSRLSATEEKSVDKWILEQVALKNSGLARDTKKDGLFIVDRTPLDAITFTKKRKVANKAKMLLEHIKPSKESHNLVSGKVILLIGDSTEISDRVVNKTAKVSPKDISKSQDRYRSLFTIEKKPKGVLELYTHGLSVQEVVRAVAYEVHMRPYFVFDMQKRLEELAKGK